MMEVFLNSILYVHNTLLQEKKINLNSLDYLHMTLFHSIGLVQDFLSLSNSSKSLRTWSTNVIFQRKFNNQAIF